MSSEYSENLEKLASAVLALQKMNDDLADHCNYLEGKMEVLEKRASVEQILVDARRKDGSPSKLVTHTIEDFLSKRAMLENQKDDEIEKVATMIRYLDDNDGIISLDENESRSSSGDFTDWLMSI